MAGTRDILSGQAGGMPARFEMKYVVPERQARRISAALAGCCDPDTTGSPDGNYVISSLYLDSPERALFWDKKLLRWDRMKARVRTYGARADGPVFLELKRRYGDVVSKSRLRFPGEAWPVLIAAPGTFDPAAWGVKDGPVLQDFRLQCLALSLRPELVVRYEREAWVGHHDRGIRVTLDRAVRFHPIGHPEIPADDAGYRPLVVGCGLWTPEPRVILELKFTWAFPRWMQDLVERFDLDRGSFSKYTRSMDQALGDSDAGDPTALGSVVDRRWTIS